MIRRDYLNEVSKITSNMYAALLAAKTEEERVALFKETDEFIWKLQNTASVMNKNSERTVYNAIRDNRIGTYTKFMENTMAISENDPAVLKSMEVGIAFENADLVKATEEYMALNPENFRFVEERIAEYAKTFGVSTELAKCYFAEKEARKELTKQFSK